MKKHTITAEDLQSNPLLGQLGLKEGDTIKGGKDEGEFSTFDGEEGGEETKGGHDPISNDPIKP